MRTTSIPVAEQTDQGALHRLFVEGTSDTSTDVVFIAELMTGIRSLDVRPLGSSLDVRGVAQALHRVHPTYYFVVDRDHHDPAVVERSWDRFPDPEQHNVLVWRKRMLESYFLDPDFLAAAGILAVPVEDLRRRILDLARRRIFLDIANLVIVRLRESVKKSWIATFEPTETFATAQEALARLLDCPEWGNKSARTTNDLSRSAVEQAWTEELNACLGGSAEPEWDCGVWLDRIDAKAIFSGLMNGSCFRVEAGGRALTGEQKRMALLKLLARVPDDRLPADVRDLRRMVVLHIGSVPV